MMDKIKMINKYMDKKTKVLLLAMVGIIILIAIITIVINLSGDKVYTYAQVEDKMISAAKSYYTEEENITLLPAADTEAIVTVDTLVTAKKIKPLTSMLKDGASCSGEVKVINIGNNEYMYLPYLNCGEAYYSTELYNKLKVEDLVTSGDGLYQIGTSYVYRGQNVQNFITFANETWRVVNINEKNETTIILYKPSTRESYVYDDRYNLDRENNAGINDFNVSRLKDTLSNYLNTVDKEGTPLFSDADKKKLVSTTLCTGNRGENIPFADNKIECNTTLEGVYAGLLSVYDYAQASLDATCTRPSDLQCQNYNYLGETSNSGSWWLMTGNSDISYEAYRIKSNGAIEPATCNNRAGLRPTIVLNSTVFLTGGEGTLENPYTIR